MNNLPDNVQVNQPTRLPLSQPNLQGVTMMAGERSHVIGGVGGGVVIMVIEGGFGVMFDLNIKLLMGFGQEFDL